MLVAKSIDHSLDFCLVVAGGVLALELIEGQPRLIILVFFLHLCEVHVQAILLRIFVAKVQLNSSVVALLQVLLELWLVVVEV